MMGEVNVSEQIYTAALAVGIGILLCLIYDFLRAIREYRRTGYITVFFMDILFFCIAAFAEFSFFQLYFFGKIRAYVIALSLFGFIICRITFSGFYVKIIKVIIKNTVLIFKFIFRFLYMFLKAFGEIALKLLKIVAKPFKYGEFLVKKLLKKSKDIVYNNREVDYGFKKQKRTFNYGHRKEKKHNP